MSSSIVSKKTCGICGQDCSNSPRFKDDQGQYFHESCYHQQQTVQSSAPEQPRSPSSFRSGQNTNTRKPNLTSKRGKPRSSHVGVSMIELLISFEGRASRSQFWIVGLGLFILTGIIEVSYLSTQSMILYILSWVLIWPGLVIGIKRWHDRDKSGFWILIGLIPFIGWAWTLIELGFLKGTDGPNSYGSDPT